MKILFASSSSGSRGGGELFLLYLGRALVNSGHEVCLWMSKHPRMDELERLFSPIGRVVRSDYKNTYDLRGRACGHLFHRNVSPRVAAEWVDLAPDIIHVNKQNLEDGLDLLEAADQTGRPSLATIHITQDARYLGAKLWMFRDWTARHFLQRYRGVLVPIQAQREEELRRFVGKGVQIRLVVNGVPIFDLKEHAEKRAAKRAQLGISDDQVLIVGVGRMVAQKRPMHWLEWARKIRAAIPSARFLWVGDGPLAGQFDSEKDAGNLHASVQRVSWTNDVPPFLFGADIFMHTAEFEGLSLALLEALSAGLPVAVTENLGSEMPFLNPGNSLILSDAIRWGDIVRDRTHLVKMGCAARTLAKEQFSFDRMACDYMMLYQELLRKNS